jgi:hypothetical protein
LQLYEGNDSGRATFDWVPTRQYLLFLSYSPDQGWKLDGCGNSGPLNGAAAALSAMAAIRSSHDATISGIVSQQALSTPIAGVHVQAQQGQQRFETVTNDRGEFRFKVPPGLYSVRAVDSVRTFDVADISYDDLKYPIEAGGCAQAQFAEVPTGPPGR